MTFEEAKNKLEQHGQAHVLRFWDTLDGAAQAALLAQIETLDFDSIARMQKMLLGETEPTPCAEPLAPEVIEGLPATKRAEAREAGEELLRAGKVAVLLVAGGQGSRLGYEGPKGAYPIGPVSGRSLFYFHARKIVGMSSRYGKPIPFYIMTSATNDAATKAHFEAHDYFGLNREDVMFFQQGEWPALDEQGNIILDAQGHIFMSPDGHGGTLSALDKSGRLADMEKRGITSVFYFQVDNPLVDIADPVFIGLHATHGADVSLKVCAKRTPDEGMGVPAIRNGSNAIVEYTELTKEQAHRQTADGELYFKFGSVAIHVFSVAFLRQRVSGNLPLHVAHKRIPMCDADGNAVPPDRKNGYKFEKYIFDVLPHAQKVVNLAFDRADEFSPVKNQNTEPNDTPATCQRDLQAKWRRWLAQHGVQVRDDIPLEIDPAYLFTPGDLKDGLRIGYTS